jgi:hypothetical protein
MPAQYSQGDVAQPKRTGLLHVMVLLIAMTFAAGAGAQPPARQDAERVLQPVGDLECMGSRLTNGRIGTKLSCKLTLAGQQQKGNFQGEMYGDALYLALPAKGRVVWKVLAPNPGLKPRDLAGDYDRVSRHAFQYPRDNRKVLVGGKGDVVGLELTVPAIDGLDASTLLTLRRLP